MTLKKLKNEEYWNVKREKSKQQDYWGRDNRSSRYNQIIDEAINFINGSVGKHWSEFYSEFTKRYAKDKYHYVYFYLPSREKSYYRNSVYLDDNDYLRKDKPTSYICKRTLHNPVIHIVSLNACVFKKDGLWYKVLQSKPYIKSLYGWYIKEENIYWYYGSFDTNKNKLVVKKYQKIILDKYLAVGKKELKEIYKMEAFLKEHYNVC